MTGKKETSPGKQKWAQRYRFVQQIREDMEAGARHNKRSVEKLAASFGITDKTEVKEYTELAITEQARELAHVEKSLAERYFDIVKLYRQQVNLSHRTSQSILLQQYSTPAPIAFLAGIFVNADDPALSVFEPSAGNGLLTIAAHQENVVVNEMDDLRRWNLEAQGFKQVLKQDATQPFKGFEKKFDAVLTNPPFGKHEEVKYETFPIKTLDFLMALRALDCMKDDGKAAIIIGGHNRYDRKRRFQKGDRRYFFNYLYSRYHVADLIQIDGHKLYSRQGTSFDVRLILVSGRKAKPSGAAPLADEDRDRVMETFEELFQRVINQTEPRLQHAWQYTFDEFVRKWPLGSGLYTDYKGMHRREVEKAIREGKPVPPQVLAEHVEMKSALTPGLAQALQSHRAMKAKYPDRVIFVGANDRYVTFGADALQVTRSIGGEIHDLSEPSSTVRSGYTSFPMAYRDGLLDKLTRKGLNIALIDQLQNPKDMTKKRLELEAEALALELELLNFDEGLGMAYSPASESCVVLDTVVPDSMGYETHAALYRIKGEIGGDVDEYVRKKLHYKTKIELCKALSAEQIDAVALAIYNIEERGQGMIIGDQTGIGKGRVAASIIRYGAKQGFQPVFLTEKANLFSDLYRDLAAIGSAHLAPFIVNARESKTDIKDEEGNTVYQALPAADQERIFGTQRIPGDADFVVATYSQFNSPERKPKKPAFLMAVAEDNILIMDEAHNSSGSGNTGNFMQSVLYRTRGVVFLSATFARRVDNMPIYAMKTAISEASMSREALVEAVVRGGVALQEVLASQLVAEGQMIRRERSFEGVEVNYITLEDKQQEHQAISDNITGVVRSIIGFQKKHVDKVVEELDEIAMAEGKQVELREGTSQAGVDNLPYFSKVFNVINQMLFSIKAEAVAERAIMRLKEGKKPVIAFSSTMGSFIEQMENERGLPVSDGDVINADFSNVLQRGLDGVMRYTVTGPDGRRKFETFSLEELGPEAVADYHRISEKIRSVSTGITISPIDVIIQKLEEAGYSVAEVTGRKYRVQLNTFKNGQGLGEPGGEPDYRRGDRVTVLSTGKAGTVQYVVQTGLILPGANNSKNYVYEYDLEMDDGRSEHSVKEKDLRPYSRAAGQPISGLVLARKRENTNDAFRRFNNNEVDVLLINQSGSTGASAHAIVTPKVPKEKVRQRVMIVLQAELDISTEVQKRGRINRTGQLYKPVYDYVNSAIPAEQRLMMMLQKKLKSLDANTTSNQKSSTKILDVPDFLNKYGDKIVTEYLQENPEVNLLLDDPLNLLGSDSGPESGVENAAHKVSGRVAVLSTKMQQDFYNEVSESYHEYVEYLKQTGDYDLEVEAMDLQAETVNARAVIVGKGGRSAFGDDSILETIKANVLKKPFTGTELNNLLTEALQGREAREIRQEIKSGYETFVAESLEKELEENNRHYETLVQNIPQEKKLQKIRDREGVAAYEAAAIEREKELEKAQRMANDQIKKNYSNKQTYILSLFDFFYIGRNLNYPVTSYDAGVENVFCVFLGFMIDRKKKNPYAPSAIRLRFALASSNKYVAPPGNYHKDVNAIKGASVGIEDHDREATLAKWEEAIKENTVDRKIRHMVTGNLLQAFGEYHGKLVSYTTTDGATKKGILMPESWTPGNTGQEKVNVPIGRVMKLIRSMNTGVQLTTGNEVSLFKQPGTYRIIVSASRKRSGDVFLDEDILALVEGHNFERVSGKMAARLDERKIVEFVNILQDKFNDSVTLTMSQYNIIKDDIPKKPERVEKPVVVPPPRRQPEPEAQPVQAPKPMSDLELEAMALELELELLEFGE